MSRLELESSVSFGGGLLIVLLLGGMLLFYRLRLRALPPLFRLWIFGARTLFFLLVAALIIDPHLTWRRLVEVPPKIGIFLDNSLSMSNHSTSAVS
ncbi:MAG: hypothetical protein IID15_06220, partial [Candidatus Marinimicrobia bacterium]|nr:hypothetical protein [Candidatus Neomarinimicrobiota bacterium]